MMKLYMYLNFFFYLEKFIIYIKASPLTNSLWFSENKALSKQNREFLGSIAAIMKLLGKLEIITWTKMTG